MGVLFIDSFDHYTTLEQKWTVNTSTGLSIGAYGRFSTNGRSSTHAYGYITKTGLGNQTTLYVGLALQVNVVTNGKRNFISFLDGSTVQCCLCVDSNGTLVFGRGYPDDTWTEVARSTNAVSVGVWNYVEIKVVFGQSTAGSVIVKVNEVEWINSSSIDTCYGANAYANVVGAPGLQNASNSGTLYTDDLYIADDDFKGDCRVQCLMPTGAGNYSQWTPSTGSNYACVDEKPPDTADYVAEGTAGDIDTYVVENLTPTGGTVYAVAGNFYCQKNDAGSRQIAIATRLSSTDDAGSGIAVPSSWGFIQDIKATKPGGGSWTVTDVNNCEMGQKMIA